MSRHTFWQRLVAVLGVALLVAVVGSRSLDVFADPKGYEFTPLVFLGDPTPEEGDTFLAVFESNRINNRGDVLFGTEVPRKVPTEFEFGLFLLRKGEISQIARSGEPAPGGGDSASPFCRPPPSTTKGMQVLCSYSTHSVSPSG
jgi:hypothetical protein